ncbi:uncharacterized protein LOC105736704 [Apis florea]|uniref:uncharacterized protein LOC105736704 n=1 Tax=Apis florea TaxID=7463 RepID=UPI00062958AD|nr:uncharacterized protein LOC105736704 [Apis florea]
MGGVGRPSPVLRRCAVASPWPWVGGGCARSNHRRIRGMPVGSAGQPWERRPATRGFAVVAECLLRSRGREKDGRSASVPSRRALARIFRARYLERGFHAPRAKRNRARGWNRGEDVHAHASSGPWMRAMGNHGISLPRRDTMAEKVWLHKIGTFVIYPVDPGFCRIVNIRSSSLQVSYG